MNDNTFRETNAIYNDNDAYYTHCNRYMDCGASSDAQALQSADLSCQYRDHHNVEQTHQWLDESSYLNTAFTLTYPSDATLKQLTRTSLGSAENHSINVSIGPLPSGFDSSSLAHLSSFPVDMRQAQEQALVSSGGLVSIGNSNTEKLERRRELNRVAQRNHRKRVAERRNEQRLREDKLYNLKEYCKTLEATIGHQDVEIDRLSSRIIELEDRTSECDELRLNIHRLRAERDSLRGFINSNHLHDL